jgi:hypothetical protein
MDTIPKNKIIFNTKFKVANSFCVLADHVFMVKNSKGARMKSKK